MPVVPELVRSRGRHPGAAPSSPPRIGLPTYVEQAWWGAWDRRAALLPGSYVEAVARAGGVPVLLPPVDVPGAAEAAIEPLDGLLLTGGADVDPGRYGSPPGPATGGLRPDRDRWEDGLLAVAMDRDLPVLAVCRGLQLLDVALGGSLHQHVPDVVGHEGHRPVPGTYGTTHVTLRAGSRVAAILGDDVEVPCHHHQSIERLAEGLEVSGVADDGIIEAVEAPGRRFLVGVQWHPEDGGDPRLFEALVAAAAVRS
jgi:anthranilate synthase component 2/putative glutamine amidotransferase